MLSEEESQKQFYFYFFHTIFFPKWLLIKAAPLKLSNFIYSYECRNIHSIYSRIKLLLKRRCYFVFIWWVLMFSQTRLILVREKSENLKFLKSGRPAFSQSSNLDVSLGSDIPGYAGIRSPFFILTVKLRNSFFYWDQLRKWSISFYFQVQISRRNLHFHQLMFVWNVWGVCTKVTWIKVKKVFTFFNLLKDI